MADQETLADDIGTCAYCDRPLADKGKRPRSGQARREKDHIIPDKHGRGGCDCPENKVWVCSGRDGCNETKRDMTPLEYYNFLDSNGRFDDGGYSLRQRERFLAQCAYWEARALAHLHEKHGKRPFYKRATAGH
jgi:hypothetical protein